MNLAITIINLLNQFQAGYYAREASRLDEFMELFTHDVEIIGTNGSYPGKDEWYLDQVGARALVSGDWEDWGDLKIDFDAVRIHERGNVGWVSIPATVTKIIGDDNYQSYLDYVKSYMDLPNIPAKNKLLNILRGGTNTVFELNRGEKFVWPIRITAVVLNEDNGWKFAQMCFSFSTIYFPDVREFEKLA